MRMHPLSYNGQALERDQFAWALKPGQPFTVGGVEAIVFRCPSRPNGLCMQKVTLGEPVADPQGNRWHWDGNMEAPTLSPSIDCSVPRRCGWHGHIINGEVRP